ncbi:MAG: DUF5777 family beta-barrel protein [Saprospiraceae bacterium]
MKNQLNTYDKWVLIALSFVFFAGMANAQDDAKEKDLRPVKNTFESTWIIDNQSVMVPFKGTFQFDIQHRFGRLGNGYDDFWGLYANSNIRLGFGYVPIERLMIGFGLTKTNITWDINAKYAFLRQARIGGSPVSLTYYGNMAFDTRKQEIGQFANKTDRYSYFHQLILARKFSDIFSVQVAGSLSHFNAVEAYTKADNTVEGKWKNDHYAMAISLKYKVSDWINFMVDFNQPLTKHNLEEVDPYAGFAVGLELTSSSHQFQIFLGNYNFITPQRNNVFNQNQFLIDKEKGGILIGFNMTRLWSF